MATKKKYEVPRTFTVPDTIDGVIGLLTARGWERAAIVYAFTTNEGKGGDNVKDLTLPTEFPCSMAAFARLGISGLGTRQTVMFYRAEYVKAIEDGVVDMVGPGDTIDVPTGKFPHVGHDKEPSEDEQAAAEEAGVSAKQVARVAANPAVLKAAIKSSPQIAEAAAEALDEVLVAEAEDAQLQAMAGGGKVTPVVPRPKGTDFVPDVLTEDAERGEPITVLENALEDIEAARDLVVANGDPKPHEVKALEKVVDRLGSVYTDLGLLLREKVSE